MKLASKQIHYNIDAITKLNATYNLIYGEKSNGKSYQVKHKKRSGTLFKNWKKIYTFA